MNDWALQSDYPGVGDASGWSWPITLNFYNVDSSSGTPQHGTLIYSTTQTFDIPWAAVGSLGANLHQDFLIDFNLPNVAVPSEFIFSVVYSTKDYGPSPTGADGPYISLNVGLPTAPPQVGTRPNPDTGYMNADGCIYYFDNCAGGLTTVGSFRQDTGWTPYSLGAEFDTAAPEPGPFGLLLCGGIVIVFLARKRGSRAA
jgi:hypothetical protein